MEKEPFFGFLNLNWDHRESAFANPTAFAAGRLSRASSSQSPKSLTTAQFEESESAASEHRAGTCEDNTRKRKATPKVKAAEVEDPSAKKPKPAEAPKQDYIHVRARRGQATDSHSLAERVRREKISERMKLLQDLVPGCDKVTGKAVMLDEIINYVQSLQRQVEFLSMKLSTVIPRPDFDVDALFAAKDMNHPRGPVPANLAFPAEAASAGFPYVDLAANGAEARRAVGVQFPNLDGFMDASAQLGAFWEDDLQSVVQMGFGQNQGQFDTNSLPTPTNRMKIEL